MKKVFSSIFVFLMAFILVGCTPTNQKDLDTLQNYVNELSIETEINDDFYLPRTVGQATDHTITWTSNNEIVKIGGLVEKEGIQYYLTTVEKVSEDKTVELKAIIEMTNGQSLDKTFVITIKANQEQNNENKLESYISKITVPSEVTENFHLQRTVDNLTDHEISWESSNPSAIRIGNIADVDGVNYFTANVIPSTEDKTVVLTATVELSTGETKQKDFTVIVKGNDGTSISEIKASTLGTYTAVGTVVGFNAQSFVLQDSSASILVYQGYGWIRDITIGDKVSVTGSTTVYANAVQFDRGAVYEKVASEVVNYPTPKELTVSDCDNYLTAEKIDVEYVSVTGVVSVSEGTKTYYNLTISGSKATGSITYPADEAAVKALNGKSVKVTGYVTGVSSSKYLNILTTNVETLGGTDPDQPATTATISEVKQAGSGDFAVTGTVVGVNAQSFVLQDSSASILVYQGYGWSQDLTIGDVVTVTGATAIYANAVQFGNTSTYEKTSTASVTYPNPKELTTSDCDSYLTAGSIDVEYVTVIGVVSVSEGTKTYYNLTISGANITGSITYPADEAAVKALNGKTVKVTGYVTGVSGSSTKYLNLLYTKLEATDGTNPDQPSQPTTISEVKQSNIGNYTVTGTVVGVNAQSFVLQDETASILVYQGYGWSQDLTIGDVVTVTGATAIYANAVQFGNTSTYEKTSTASVTYPNPKELTIRDCDNYLSAEKVEVEYVSVIGVVSVSEGTKTYYNLTIEGSSIVGSITYPADEAAVKALNGKTVKVTGYVTGVSGSSTKYLNLLFINIEETEEVEITDEIKLQYAQTQIEALDGKVVKANINLPTALEKYSLTVEWASNSNYISNTGVYTAPLEDTEVTLTATIICEKVVLGTIEIKMTAKPQSVGSKEVSLDFVSLFGSYASTWSSSYTSHTISASDLGNSEVKATISFSRANKQAAGNSIDDRPVLAANGGSAYVEVLLEENTFETIQFDLKQWTTKTFNDIHIEYNNGTTWVKCSDSITTPGLLESNSNLPAGTSNHIRLVVNTTAAKNTQLGLTGINFKMN